MLAATSGCGRVRAGGVGASRTPPPTAGRSRICHCEPVRTLAWQSVTPSPVFIFYVFKWQFENTSIPSFFILHFSFHPKRIWQVAMASNARRYERVRAGGVGASRTPPPTADAGGGRRDADGRVPSLRREGPGFVIARPVRRLVVALASRRRNLRPLFQCFQMAI